MIGLYVVGVWFLAIVMILLWFKIATRKRPSSRSIRKLRKTRVRKKRGRNKQRDHNLRRLLQDWDEMTKAPGRTKLSDHANLKIDWRNQETRFRNEEDQ